LSGCALIEPIAQIDAQIARVTRSRGAQLATRNDCDFNARGFEEINPWRNTFTAI
jgi:predicted nucleic acid-binding protein